MSLALTLRKQDSSGYAFRVQILDLFGKTCYIIRNVLNYEKLRVSGNDTWANKFDLS